MKAPPAADAAFKRPGTASTLPEEALEAGGVPGSLGEGRTTGQPPEPLEPHKFEVQLLACC